MVKVSVIVPIYNVENYIRTCLNSLTQQTIKDIEIILVDDGSKDHSSEIAKEYAEKYDNITYYRKENGGLSDARNYGMQYAKGEYIAFLDSDDYIDFHMYEKMYEKAKQDDSDLVECDFYWVYDKKKREDVGQLYVGKKQMMEKARVMAWNKLYKRDMLEKANIQFPKSLQYEDIEFFYKLIPYINTVSFVKEPLVYYIQRKNSIANTQNEKTADIFTVFEHIFDYYQQLGYYDEYKDVLEYSYARILLCSSFKRMVKIQDKQTRRKLLDKTWSNLNTQFPDWKQNPILNRDLDNKKRYMKMVNSVTYRIFAIIFKMKK